MPHRYLDTLTTPTVQAARERHGSRTSMDRLIRGWDTDRLLGPDETAYIAGRDGFYLATVGETGWPYVQYRGGSPGFLHVLPPRDGPSPERHSVLAWADLRGNRQYLSVGNLGFSPRVSLFLMDYAGRRRLKVLGTAAVVDVGDDDVPADLTELVGAARAEGRVERVVTVDVHGYDWNCPQHITPRWTEAELGEALAPIRDELARLRAENERLRSAGA